jgi:hypothetical protein
MSNQIEVLLTEGRKVHAVYGSNSYDAIAGMTFLDYMMCQEELDHVFNTKAANLQVKTLLDCIVKGDVSNMYSEYIKPNFTPKQASNVLGSVYRHIHNDICRYFSESCNRHEDGWPMFPAYLDTFENRTRFYYKLPTSSDFPYVFVVLLEELDLYYDLWKENLLAIDNPDSTEWLLDLDYVWAEARRTGRDVVLINS